ncbi:bifunctional Helicase superfamily 1-2 [Babesia duncani]|uniref:Bifunctional Helicase superfamily 1-2 n=1 Tax=Babesia duncani TaxID=323732 RepID=A0AAD9UMQ4_9APIC|nr:bifunctional Helicase superfamily 1-2 [Babesia duncani]KAK2196793.1 bifunctional Helicase superfamily 1-2 [Babesia duncani]
MLAMENSVESNDDAADLQVEKESSPPMEAAAGTQQYSEVPQPPMYYQNQMVYSRPPGRQQVQQQQPQMMGQQQQNPQMMPQQIMGPQMMRMHNGMRPGQMYYYPMPMYNQQMMMQNQQSMQQSQMMPQQGAMMSKFMPQYSAYLGRMHSDTRVKSEPTEEQQTPSSPAASQQPPQSPQMGHVQAMQQTQQLPPNYGPPRYNPQQQPQPSYGYPMGMNPMLMYGQPNRLLVGSAIDGIPALRMASSQFQNVTQMLDALAKQPPKKRRTQRSRDGKDEDPDFKSVMHEYFDSKNDSDDEEYFVGRSVRDADSSANIRRSGRNRTRNTMYAEYGESDGDNWTEEQGVKMINPSTQAPRNKRRGPGAPRQRQPRSNANPYSRQNFVTYDDTDESDVEYQEPGVAPGEGKNPGTLRTRARRRLNYAEMEQDAWEDMEEQPEDWENEYDADQEGGQYQQQKESVGGIDRIINNRVNEEGVTEYLIKWQGFAHIHNTWETYDNLVEYNGIKRLDNYIKRLKQLEARKNYMTVDEIEQENIAMELQRQIDDDALQAERIVSHYLEESSGKTIYLVKWRSCPYDQCTEEEEEVLREHDFGKLIEKYHDREDRISGEQARKYPWNSHSISLTKFEPYMSTPSYLANGEKQLRDYQLTGLNWMVNRMKRGLSVLLADEMGLGKTVQTISLVGHFMYKEFLIGPYLVIVPQSTIDNWMREFETWLPQANVVCYYGNATARDIIRYRELSRVYVPGKGERYKCDVCITTPSIINSAVDLDFLRRISWQLMVVDEAHQLKNRNSKRFVEMMQFMADYKLLLSGTPLHNNLEELWTLLHFINPQIYTYYEEFRRRYSEIENPVAIGETKQRQLLTLQQELHEVVLRRVKRDVEKSLPNKVERILRVELSPMQIEWYKNILTRNYDQLAKNSGGSRSSLQNICMELKKVCNHPFLCYEPEDRQQWLQGLVYGSGKICLLEKLLLRLKERGHRVLIFSQMVRMLNIISEYLTLKGFKHQRLDGTMGKELRKKAMDHFNDPQSDDFCFLLSTKAGGLGINLTTADTVIIYDSDWNPQNDLQAEARAHRIGQTKTVQIYRLVTKDSIEQTILERAKTKMVLDALVIQGLNKKSEGVVLQDDSGKGGFSREELAKILKFGASKLWARSSSGEGGESSEGGPDVNSLDIDLDKVLEEAEVTTTGVAEDGLATDLLNSYTNITEFRYEPPEEQSGDAAAESNKDFWEATIPLEERLKLKKKKEEELMVLGPRRTRAKESGAMEAEDFSGDEDDEGDADFQPRRLGRRPWGQSAEQLIASGKRGPRGSRKAPLTIKDKVKVYRSLAKFGVPELRLGDICADSKLHKVDARIILNECQNLIDTCKARCLAAIQPDADEKRQRRIIELGDVKINPADFLERLSLLESLEQWGRSQAGAGWAKSSAQLEVPPLVLQQINESKERWTQADCVNMLKLIHIYGYGYWTLMCADNDLCVGVLKGMKHDRAKSRTIKMLRLLRDALTVPPTASTTAPVPDEGVDYPESQSEPEDDSLNVLELLESGQALRRTHYAAAVKWALGPAKDLLKRLKQLKETQPDALNEQVKQDMPQLTQLIARAQDTCKDPQVAQRLASACWTFVAKFTSFTPQALEMQAAQLQESEINA